ncbi:hypothetical protein HQ45_02575 [Porphyromonas crevioricanis]|uniref:Uncharacterized protein n=2 Tax=Porphyromonas crevioricanis TaxID=393921 RepID=A0AB34PIQ9_9PORP|nr:hypothetical protein HQ45_02575 [Porphyromonas crevioricanis]KGN95103.1 hypothetical protein HQ38_04835 [Porphyromonas crevioricanis]GAD05992.1 hypothetical protein PORCRE_1706 [Porphyromonas crevioricanis JCM 15906]
MIFIVLFLVVILKTKFYIPKNLSVDLPKFTGVFAIAISVILFDQTFHRNLSKDSTKSSQEKTENSL